MRWTIDATGARFVVGLALLVAPAVGVAQCANNNTPIAGGAITPNCPGSTTVPCVQGGQYALVNVTSGNTYTFATCGGASFDTQITLYNDAGGGSLGYNDDGCGLQSTVTWAATFTGQLRVLVDRYNCANQATCATLTINCVVPPPPITNGNCGVALTLPVLSSCFMQSFHNIGASNSGPTPGAACGAFGGQFDVWFRFTAPASGRVVIETQGITMTDGVMQLYTGTCGGGLSVVQCVDDVPGSLMPRIDRRCNPLVPFQTYLIRVWGYNGQTGWFNICVRGWDVFTAPQEDCIGGATICGNALITNQTNWTGCTADLNGTTQGCLSLGERQGTWYFFSPIANGTVAFAIQPVNPDGTPANVDYDFAIWGPLTGVSCPPSSPPIRCSYAAPPHSMGYVTGMGNGATDWSETAFGNGWVAPLPVIQDMVYIMFVDNWTTTGQAFNLTWTLSQPDLLDCTVLPMELTAFDATAHHDRVVVKWTTTSERNTASFVVERSPDGQRYEMVAMVEAAGHSLAERHYSWSDAQPLLGVSYYRLRSVDHDGSAKLSSPASVFYQRTGGLLSIFPNPAENSVSVLVPNISGPVLITLSDMRGRVVRESLLEAGKASNSLTVPLLGLESGSYLLKLADPGGPPIGVAPVVKH